MAQSGKRGNPLACRTRLEPKPLLSWAEARERDCHSIADEVTVFLCLTGRGGWGQPRPRGRGSCCNTRWLTRAPYAVVPQPAPPSLSVPQAARRCRDVPGGPYAEAYACDSTQALFYFRDPQMPEIVYACLRPCVLPMPDSCLLCAAGGWHLRGLACHPRVHARVYFAPRITLAVLKRNASPRPGCP